MYSSALEDVIGLEAHRGLLGKRVLVTGIGEALGCDLVRAFAEQGTRLVLEAPSAKPEVDALAEIAITSALDVRLYCGEGSAPAARLPTLREAIRCYGGIDAVVNVITLDEPRGLADDRDVEQWVTDKLSLPVLSTKIAANRMAMLGIGGTILNVMVEMPRRPSGAILAASIARSSLAQFTRGEARRLAADGIRLNAVVPAGRGAGRDSMLDGTADVASLALHLAGDRGEQLSGLVFEAYCG